MGYHDPAPSSVLAETSLKKSMTWMICTTKTSIKKASDRVAKDGYSLKPQ